MADKNLSAILANMYGFQVDKNPSSSRKGTNVQLTKKRSGSGVRYDKDGNAIASAQKFDSYTDRLYREWKTLKVSESEVRSRLSLYVEMDNMYLNSALISRAMKLWPAEIVQADANNNRILSVQTKNRALKKRAEECIIRCQMDAKMQSTAFNMIKYGDAYWMLAYGKNRIEDVLEADPNDVFDRIEFTPHEVARYFSGNQNPMLMRLGNDQKIRHMAKLITEDEDYSSFFRSYLFGFQVHDYLMPAWRMVHFRRFTTNENFYPFGVPRFIHSIYPWKQYEFALGFQALLRRAKLPIDRWALTVPEGLTGTDAVDYVLEMMRAYDNSGLRDTKKEENAVGEKIFTIKDQFDWDQIVPNIDLGRIEDIDMMRQDLAISTGLPIGLLIPDGSVFGNGSSLVEQWKPFRREVYSDQSTLMTEIIQVLKLDALMSGDFTPKDVEDLAVSMPFPESQTSQDIIDSQNNLLSLANNVIDGLKERIFGSEEVSLPIEVLKDVYETILPYDRETVNRWINAYVKAKDEAKNEPPIDDEETPEPDEGAGAEKKVPEFTFEKFKRTFKDYNTLLKECIESEKLSTYGYDFKERRNYGDQRHVVSGRVKATGFEPSMFLELKSRQINLLTEKRKKRGRIEMPLSEEQVKHLERRSVKSADSIIIPEDD